MRCYLIRHAQTLWNQEQRFQGRTDLSLGPRGREQAACLARHFSGQRFASVYSSDLARSVQTAQAIADATQAALIIEPGLAEMDLGAWEGLTGQEIDARFDGAYRRWCAAPSRVSIVRGEALETFHRRVRSAFARIAAAHQDGELVVVSHGGAIASLLAQWLRKDYDQVLGPLALENAGITSVDWTPERVSILFVNHTGHLIGLGQGGQAPIR